MNYTTRKSTGNQSFPPSQVGRTYSLSEGAEQAFSNNLVYKILALTFRKDQASPLKPVSQDQCQPRESSNAPGKGAAGMLSRKHHLSLKYPRLLQKIVFVM